MKKATNLENYNFFCNTFHFEIKERLYLHCVKKAPVSRAKIEMLQEFLSKLSL